MFRILINTLLIVILTCWPVLAKEYSGSAWVDDQCKYYNGSAWVDCVKNYYDGASWGAIEAGSAYSSDVLTHWTMSDYTIDYQASGNSDSDAVTQNQSSLDSGGQFGNALDPSYSSSSDRSASIALSNGNGIDITTGSIQFWYKYDGVGSVSTSSYYFGGESSTFGLRHISATRLDLMWNGQYIHLDHAGTDLQDESWHHIRVAWEYNGSTGTTAYLYLGGSTTAVDSEYRAVANYAGFSGEITIGAADASNSGCHGLFDNLYISDSLTEVHGYAGE